MYDEELDMALEDAYDDGYVQALIDMGIDHDEIAEEASAPRTKHLSDETAKALDIAMRKSLKNATRISLDSIPDTDEDEKPKLVRRKQNKNISKESVDIFDDNYFDEATEDVDMYDDYDEAMEGPAREYRHKMNAGKTPEEIHKERKITLNMFEDPRFSTKYTARGRHFRDFHPEMKEELIKERDDNVREYDTDEGERIRSDVDRKYGEKAAKKVRDDYNARTRAQYDAIKSKLQSSDLTPAQKRAVMEKFKARKLEEKRAVDRHALSTKYDARKHARDLHWKQLCRRKGYDKFLKEDE